MKWNNLELPDKNIYFQDDDVVIYNADCREILPELPDMSIDLIWTSPPYFVGKDYEKYLPDRKAYLALVKDFLHYSKWLMGEGKYIVVNCAHNSEYDLPSQISMMMRDEEFNFEDNIIWEKPDGASPRFGSFVQNPFVTWYLPNQTYEHLIVYTKGKVIRERKTPIDLQFALKYRGDIWRQKAETNSKHEAPFSEQLSYAVLTFYSNTNDIILDPFLGSGTTAYCAKKLGRKCIGIEIEESYARIAVDRLRQSIMKL